MDNRDAVPRSRASLPGVSRIETDPGGLAAAGHALADAAQVADAVHRGARTLTEPAAACGSAHLADALERFRGTWAYGLGLVVDDARTLSRMLDQAASAYAGIEGAIGQACR